MKGKTRGLKRSAKIGNDMIATIHFKQTETGHVTPAQHKTYQATAKAMIKREQKQLLEMHKLVDQAAGLFLPVELSESRAMARFHLNLLEFRDNFLLRNRAIPKWPGSLKYQRLLLNTFLQLSESP